MERKGFSFSLRGNETEKKFDRFKQEIRVGLDLDGASFLKLPKEVEEDVVNDFSRILTATSLEMNKLTPKVALINGWSEPLDGYSENHEIREILANATVDESYPNGIIRISPFYLKPEFTRRLNILNGNKTGYETYPFEFLLAHEDFHVWQFLNQYETVIEDCKIFTTGGLAAWNQTRTEIDANEYANDWILKHNIA